MRRAGGVDSMKSDRALVAIDWGTSALRGARLDDSGRVLEERSAPFGILNVPNGDFAATFAAQFGDWMKPPGALCLISGMAGSRQGWAEAPYVSCPAGPAELARHLHWIEPDRIALVPGLSDTQRDVPDVMRGEEVQIFGAMSLAGLTEGLFVLPGTHSKWATVRGGRIVGFRTFMTGEAFGLFRQHSILARTLDGNAPLEKAAEGGFPRLSHAEAIAVFKRIKSGDVVLIGATTENPSFELNNALHPTAAPLSASAGVFFGSSFSGVMASTSGRLWVSLGR